MKISISTLSIAYGLTPEALRYYEEKGLLSPSRTPSSGFRRFSITDVQRLGIIKGLQKQGFSLDEIKHILTDCPRDELIALMDEKRMQLREQITLSLAIADRMNECSDLLRESTALCMKPRLCTGCAAYLLGFDSVTALWNAVPEMPLLKDLIDALPLTSYCSIVPLARLHEQETSIRVGIAAPAQYTTVIHADFSKMRFCAGPRCVRTLFELRPPAFASLEPVLEKTIAFLKAHALTPICEGYTRQYALFIDENNISRHYSELIIPVSN